MRLARRKSRQKSSLASKLTSKTSIDSSQVKTSSSLANSSQKTSLDSLDKSSLLSKPVSSNSQKSDSNNSYKSNIPVTSSQSNTSLDSLASKPVRSLTTWQVNTSLTPSEILVRKQEYLKAFYANGGHVSKSCQVAGISTRQAYQWKKNDVDFEAAWEAVTDHRLDMAESALDRLVDKGNAAAVIFMLKTLGKRRGYIERLQLESKSNDKKPSTEAEVSKEMVALNDQLKKIRLSKKTPTLLLTSSEENNTSNPDRSDVTIVPVRIN